MARGGGGGGGVWLGRRRVCKGLGELRGEPRGCSIEAG